MKQRVETDLHVRIDAPNRWGDSRPERAELVAFIEAIKNHRDLDGYWASIDYTVEYRCSFCGLTWETEGESLNDTTEPAYDPDLPVCCEAAQAEYLRDRALGPAEVTP